MAIYLKYADFKGQVTTDGFKDWIELKSFQFGITRGVTTGARGSQRESSAPQMTDIHITKDYDDASAKLFGEATSGNFDSKVQISFTATSKGKEDKYLTYELEGCGVSSFSESSDGHNPTEAITLNFGKVTVKPTRFDAKGSPIAGAVHSWDLMKAVGS